MGQEKVSKNRSKVLIELEADTDNIDNHIIDIKHDTECMDGCPKIRTIGAVQHMETPDQGVMEVVEVVEDRYIAAHVTEPGYNLYKEAQAYINRQDDPSEWYIMKVTSNIPAEALKNEKCEQERRIKWACEVAVRAERKRIAQILGLTKEL